jgi:hypothetical protein
MLDPTKWGCEDWSVGDGATYEYRSEPGDGFSWRPPEPVVMSIDVVASASHGQADAPESRGTHWIHWDGVAKWRDRTGTMVGLACNDDLWTSATLPCYLMFPQYFPLRMANIEKVPKPVIEWRAVGRERLAVSGQEIETRKWQGEVVGRKGLVEAWTNAEVKPLGLVRLTFEGERVDLREFGSDRTTKIDRSIQGLLRGQVVYSGKCTDCHLNDNMREVAPWLR